MGRRLKASTGRPTKVRNSPVRRFSRIGGKGYSLPEAVFLLSQGYTPEHVAERTGFDPKVVVNHLARNGVPSWMKV